MPVIELGRRPDLLRILLLADAGFATSVVLLGDEEYDQAPELHFPNQAITWAADLVDSKTAVFNIPSAAANLLIEMPGPRIAVLRHGESVWATGNWETLDFGGAQTRMQTSFEIGINRPRIEVDNLPRIGGNAEPAFEFTQETPSATWIVNHNLGRFPYVDVYVDGELVETDVESTANVTTITFPAPYSGSAAIF